MKSTVFCRLKSIIFPLLATLLISGCDDNSSPYGGPYYLGGDTKNFDRTIANNKDAEFVTFKYAKGWNSSKVAILTGQLFNHSIEINSTSGAPDADQFQKYNYVIKGNEIRVAVWNDTDNNLKNICKPGLPYLMNHPSDKTMVNFYPEDEIKKLSEIGNSANKCRAIVGTKGVRVLDAHSKHFMLAQGKGTTISDYEATKKWEDKTVDYAGEIFVVINGTSCFYGLNQGSGTYQPASGRSKGDIDYLTAVAKFFESNIHISPSFVWDTNTQVQSFLPVTYPLPCPPARP